MKKLLSKYIPLLIGKKLQLQSIFLPKKATTAAFNLFCTPRKGKLQLHEKDFLASADGVNLNTNGHTIKMYHWEGSGKTIVLLHGWESNSYRWRFLVPLLQKKGYNILAVDAPAQGASSGKYLNVPLYTECLKDIAAIYNPEIILGHSLGGMTAIYFQHLVPSSSVKKIITLGPPSELNLFMKGFQSTLGLSDAFMNKMNNYLFKRFGFYAEDFSIANFAKTIKVEGLLVLEKYDNLAPYVLSTKIARNWKKCELFTVENIGHSLQSSEINKKIMASLI